MKTNENLAILDGMAYDYLKTCIEIGASTPSLSFSCDKVPGETAMMVEGIIGGNEEIRCTISITIKDGEVLITRSGGGCKPRVFRYPLNETNFVTYISNMVQGLASEVLIHYITNEWYPNDISKTGN